VVEVIDGITIKVLIGDLVYVVRYIGVNLPDSPGIAQLSTVQNGQLVFMKDVKLFSDGEDRDASNRLLRYVTVGESLLVNQELVREGLATAVTTNYSCAASFASAQDQAKAEKLGIWQVNQP
jgi:endonuclease YncB( thermonuclease family)